MPDFAANLSTLYPEHDFLDRYEAAASDGFLGVECQFPYAWPAAEHAARLARHGLRQVLLNAPPGDPARGERGLACLPGRQADFRQAMAQALAYADAMDCPRIHVMAGTAPADGPERERHQAQYLENLAWAAAQAARDGRTVLIEPLNPRDASSYFLRTQAQAHEIVEALGAPNLRVQMDLYHCQITEGDLESGLRRWLPTGRVGHLQIAGVPARREPDLGEVHYPHLFGVLRELAYEGWIGCEYHPAGRTRDGLGWLAGARGTLSSPPAA